MKKKSLNLGVHSLNPKEVEDIAYTTLCDSAKLFPKSVDDLETLENELEGVELPKPDTAKLLKMLRGELPPPVLTLQKYGAEPVMEVTESLALAARKGTKQITDDIRSKMDADRAVAEKAKLE